MAAPPRVIPVPCPFGLTGGLIWVYYIDAPEPAIVDTGVAASPVAVIEPGLAKAGIKLSDVKWILASHGHWDHIGGAQTAKDHAAPDVKIAMHSADRELLANRRAHIAGYAGARFRFIDAPELLAAHDAMLMENLSAELAADRPLTDGDRINLGGGVTVSVVHTPGHSPGAVAFVLDGTDWAFTGDSIQVGGAGGFPLIERPADYRKSVRRVLEDVRPKRLFMGHQFSDHRFSKANNGTLSAQLEGDAVASALRASLEVEAALADAAKLLDPAGDRPGNAAMFAAAAESLGFDPSDPINWPGSLFHTLSGYIRGLG
ncbi:MAG: MBL fold metallo-hydrolase [Chloroflexota bacterium]